MLGLYLLRTGEKFRDNRDWSERLKVFGVIILHFVSVDSFLLLDPNNNVDLQSVCVDYLLLG